MWLAAGWWIADSRIAEEVRGRRTSHELRASVTANYQIIRSKERLIAPTKFPMIGTSWPARVPTPVEATTRLVVVASIVARTTMGNTSSSSSKRNSRRSSKKDDVATRAQNIVGDSVREIQAGIQSGIKRLEEQDHPAAQLLDSMCGNYLDEDRRYGGGNSFYSEDVSEDDSRTISEDETTTTDYRRRRDEDSYFESDYESATQASEQPPPKRKSKRRGGEESEEDVGKGYDGAGLQKPLASSFAKRCYFTKAGIGKTTQHYEGLTLTGNVVLMLASAMKLKGCPTICDEDLRRVEQTFPNQFSRLPDELLLSSGWRRISKYCHFSNKPIPDGVPFFRKCGSRLIGAVDA